MRTILLSLLLLCGTAIANAEEPKLHGNLDAARTIARADREFAELARKEGEAKACRDVMDAVDGVIFNGDGQPAIGREAIYARAGGDTPADNTLEWHPVEVFAAESGELGVSRGRYALTSKADPAKSVTGSYVTVWRKDAKGEWKGLIDIGAADKTRK